MMRTRSGARLRGAMNADEFWVCHLGHVPYSDGVALQETLRERRLAGELPDLMLMLEHPPVYTRRASRRRRGPAVSRGLLPRQRHRRRRHRPRRQAHLPRARPARRLSRSWASTTIGRYLRTMEDADRRRARRSTTSGRARDTTRGSTTPASGSTIARSHRSACTSRAASPRTASPSTSTTTSSRSRGCSPAGCPTCR